MPSFPLGPGNKFLLKDGRGDRACCRLTETLDIVTPPGVIDARTKRYDCAVPTEDILGHAFYFVLLLGLSLIATINNFLCFQGRLYAACSSKIRDHLQGPTKSLTAHHRD